MKKGMTAIIVLAIIIIIGVCYGVFNYRVVHTGKGGEGQGMFEKNSKSVSLYKQDRLIYTFKDDERQKLVKLLKESNMHSSRSSKKKDDSYTIVLDFNNDICKLHISEENRTCYLKDDEYLYELSDEVYNFILEYLKEK